MFSTQYGEAGVAGNEGLASGVAGAVSLGPETDPQIELHTMTRTFFRIDSIGRGNVGNFDEVHSAK